MTMESNFYSGKGVNYNLNGKYVTALEFAQMTTAVQGMQSSIGSESSGMTKDIADLQAAVEALQTAVGDADSGLVKDVTTLKTVVGDSSSGLVKRVSDLENA